MSEARELAADRKAEHAETGICPRCGLDAAGHRHFWTFQGWVPFVQELSS
jgi:hypothetical protein